MPPLSRLQKSLLVLGIGQSTVCANAQIGVIQVDDDCSLIDSILSAEQQVSVGGCEAGGASSSQIHLPANQTFTLTAGFNNGNLFTGLPFIRSAVTIIGNGSTIRRDPNAASQFRILAALDDAKVGLRDTTITGGSLPSPYLGGGVYIGSSASVTLFNSSIVGNSSGHRGGGVYAAGRLTTFSGSQISNNVAHAGGGGVYAKDGNVTLNNTTVAGNTATTNHGGGLWLQGNVITYFDQSTFSGNSAAQFGGAIFADEMSSPLLLNFTTASENSAGLAGGGIYLVDSQSYIRRSSINANTAASRGGGIGALNNMSTALVEIQDTKVSRNHSRSDGGGISLSPSSSLVIRNSEISENFAQDTGGGVLLLPGAGLNATYSQFLGNHAEVGGGIYSASNNGSITLTNTTVSGNSAITGGGIALRNGNIQLSFTTVASNSAAAGGGLFAKLASSLNLMNSIIADSYGGDCDLDIGATLVVAPAADDQSIVESGQCNIGRRTGDPGLLPLADNGSFNFFITTLKTHALTSSSRARDSAVGNCTESDQRQLRQRPFQVSECDIGAFEQTEEERAALLSALGSFFVIPTPSGLVVIEL